MTRLRPLRFAPACAAPAAPPPPPPPPPPPLLLSGGWRRSAACAGAASCEAGVTQPGLAKSARHKRCSAPCARVGAARAPQCALGAASCAGCAPLAAALSAGGDAPGSRSTLTLQTARHRVARPAPLRPCARGCGRSKQVSVGRGRQSGAGARARRAARAQAVAAPAACLGRAPCGRPLRLCHRNTRRRPTRRAVHARAALGAHAPRGRCAACVGHSDAPGAARRIGARQARPRRRPGGALHGWGAQRRTMATSAASMHRLIAAARAAISAAASMRSHAGTMRCSLERISRPAAAICALSRSIWLARSPSGRQRLDAAAPRSEQRARGHGEAFAGCGR